MDTPNYKELYSEYKDRNHQLIYEMDYNEYTDFYSFVVDKDHLDENTNLYLLFVSDKLLEKSNTQILQLRSKTIKRTREELEKTSNETSKRTIIPTKITKYSDYILNLTPYLKSYITPSKLDNYVRDIEHDNELIEKIRLATDDSEYIDKQNYGKLVETWFADNCSCPVCGSFSLRRYAKDNFPVIDFVCINQEHTFDDGVKFFQVKSTTTNFEEFKYFDYSEKTIHTGSYKYGKIVHKINVLDDNLTKKVLIGYICITVEPKNDYLKINKTKSFFVLPNTKINPVAKKLFENNFDGLFVQGDTLDMIDKYYEYIDIANPTIMFSDVNNDVVIFKDRYEKNLIIDMNYMTNGLTSWNIINNPLL